MHQSWTPLFDKHKAIISDMLLYYEQYPLPIYPPKEDIFRVFEMDVKDIKLVFLGQDPYHGKDQAHGLAFSVNKNVKIPPSLANIYKELQNEFPERNYTFPHGNLERWFTEEKIFLLNSSLTVAEGKPSIFMQKWNPFTDDVIKFIAENNEKCIFLLLGAFAKNKAQYIECKSRIVTGTHPSPLSAYRGFLNSNIFKKLDLELTINWNI